MNVIKIISAMVLALILLMSAFTINQGQQGITLRLGRLVEDVRTNKVKALDPGLHVKAEVQAKALGIHVVDVRIKGIELPENTSAAIYQRMRADMQKIANHHRADGSATAEAIRANADAKVTVLLAKARSDGQAMRAKGD